MKRGIRAIASMRFAIAILLLLGIGSAIGTLLPQNEAAAFYLQQYGNTWGTIIYQTGISHVFTTVWFAILAVLLCISLLFCVIFRAGRILQGIQAQGFKAYLALFGSWLLHAGILLTIFFFVLGNATAFEDTVRNVPGTVTKVEGTHLSVAVDDFTMDVRDDGTVDHYTTAARILDDSGVRAEGNIQVNHPLTVDGYQFSQNATGYAVTAYIDKDDEPIGHAPLFLGEHVTADEDGIVLTLLNIYPDYIETAEGPATRSLEMNRPYVLYRVYYNGQDLGVRLQAVHQPVHVGAYRFLFTDPAMSTVLAVRKDAWAKWTGFGAGLLFLGTVLVFFAPQNAQKETEAEE